MRLDFRLRCGLYDVVTIDFRKAFDVISHDILVHKLIAVGLCEQSVRRIIMEYCTSEWSSYYKQDIDLVKGVQPAFTRYVFKRCHLQPASYNDRLAYLG